MNKTFMREAIVLSIEQMEAGEGGPFGAVVVKNDQIIGRGWNCVTSSKDPTAHAEVMAIRNACSALETFDLSGCDLYASCEPCPMCLAAIYWARVDRLFYAATSTDAAEAGFDDQMLYTELSAPWEKRSLPVEQGLQREAQKAFQLWKNKTNRIVY